LPFVRIRPGEPSVDHIPLGGFVLVKEDPISTTPNSTLKPRYPLGRRTKGRTAINHGAVVLVEGDTGVHSCPVCNVTNDGACIQLSGLNIVPPLFDLSFDNFRTTRRCRLIWRNRDLVGVAFES
jgi:hypothetical protein